MGLCAGIAIWNPLGSWPDHPCCYRWGPAAHEVHRTPLRGTPGKQLLDKHHYKSKLLWWKRHCVWIHQYLPRNFCFKTHLDYIWNWFLGFQFQTRQRRHISPYSSPFIRPKNPGQEHGKQLWSVATLKRGDCLGTWRKWSSTEGWFCSVSCTSRSECKRSWPPRNTQGHLPKDTGKPAVRGQRTRRGGLAGQTPDNLSPTPAQRQEKKNVPRIPGLARWPAPGQCEWTWLLPWTGCKEASADATCVTGAWPPPQQQGSTQAVPVLSNKI